MSTQPLFWRLATQYSVRGTVGFAALTSVALGQALLHERQYQPLPQLQAPNIGRELPEALALKLSEKREELRKRLLVRTEEVKKEVNAKSLKLKAWRDKIKERYNEKIRHIMTNLQRRNTFEEFCLEKPKYRVLFLGDSLVTGIGGAPADASEGPPLPRRVCRALAQNLGVQIEWHALGLTGGDLDDMSQNLLPKLKQLIADANDNDQKNFDVVVLMCGLNDFKYLARGHVRTPWAFGQRLSTLLDDIRNEVGNDCRIVLPALPVALASFQEPLKSYICFLANLWDKQKLRLADASHLSGGFVDFIDVITLDDSARQRTLVADDGVHPNEYGYEIWSQHIARGIANNLLTPKTQLVSTEKADEALHLNDTDNYDDLFFLPISSD